MSAPPQRCQTCGALVDAEDLFCANCGTEVPEPTRPRVPSLPIEARNFECRGCGASMNYDAGAQALKCPFCGSVDLAEEPGRSILAPELVIPFAIDRAQAEAALRSWLGSSFWRPDDLRSAAQLTDLRAVYVPFWIFATRVRTFWTADTDRTPPGARADWYPVASWHERDYADLWVPAGQAVSLGELAAILPFDPGAAVAPEAVDLARVTVEQFSVSRRYARPLAQGRLEALEADAVAAEIPGRCRNVHVNVLMQDATSRPALAPLYVMSYRYRGRLYRFVLNGQTGRATGTAPTSVAKVAVVVALVAIAVAVVALLVLR
jgi:predicted RNA-binding Zn-ribbon protein involved in translation (DUF1610 family)